MSRAHEKDGLEHLSPDKRTESSGSHELGDAVNRAQMPQTALRSLLRGLSGTALTTVGTSVVSAVTGVIIARLLSPEERGEYGRINLWLQTLALGCLASLPESWTVMRLRGTSTKAWSRFHAIRRTLSLPSRAAFLLVASAWILAPLPEHLSIRCLYAWLFYELTSLCQFRLAELRARSSFSTINIGRLATPIVLLLGALTVSWTSSASVSTLLVAILASKLVSAVIWRPRQSRCQQADQHGVPTASDGSTTSKLVLSLHTAFLLGYAATFSDRLHGTVTLPSEDLGQYLVAVSAISIATAPLNQALSITAVPIIAGVGTAAVRQRGRHALTITAIATLLLGLATSSVIPRLIPAVYGANYAPAADMASILAWPYCLIPARTLIAEFHKSIGRPARCVVMNLVGIVTYVLVASSLISRGVTGLALAALAGNAGAISAGLLQRHRGNLG